MLTQSAVFYKLKPIQKLINLCFLFSPQGLDKQKSHRLFKKILKKIS